MISNGSVIRLPITGIFSTTLWKLVKAPINWSAVSNCRFFWVKKPVEVSRYAKKWLIIEQ
jgi:hypothetical protein